jgi:hypothetical protein
MTDIIDISHDSVLCDRLDKIAEELKRIADFLVASKSIPEKESTKKKVSAGEKERVSKRAHNEGSDLQEATSTQLDSKSAEQKKRKVRKVSPGFGGSVPIEDDSDMVLRNIEVMPYAGNAYLVKRDDGKVAFIGKSLVRSIDEGLGKVTFKPSKWFTLDKIEWKEDKY